MASTDIVARLMLNAQQFSSENARAFADLKQRAATTAQDVRRTWNSAYADIQALAARNSSGGGGPDLSGRAAELRASAAAAEQSAASFRALEEAAQRSAFAEGIDTERMLQRADAARVAAMAADQDAAALREEAAALDVLNAELREMHGPVAAHTAGLRGAAGAAGASRMAMQQLSYQVQDAATQIGMGANMLQVIAIQGGQAAGAFAHVEGAAGGVARFFLGP